MASRREAWLFVLVASSACTDARDEAEATSPTAASTPGTTAPGSSGDEAPGTSAPADTGMLLDIGSATNATEGEVDGTDDCVQDVDIVFVMDVSTSMGPFLDKLAEEILVVDQALADLGLPN